MLFRTLFVGENRKLTEGKSFELCEISLIRSK
jgi:hypothetical protein